MATPALHAWSPARPLDVWWMDAYTPQLVEPHRHSYHELIWLRDGSGRHEVDGRTVEAGPGTITVIARGQVHRFTQGQRLHGALVRFPDELLHAGGAGAVLPAWLVDQRRAQTVRVPDAEHDALQAHLHAMDRESRVEAAEHGAELQRHLLSALLLWVDRWRPVSSPVPVGERRLYERFAAQLEADFPRHHDARHYADALGVAPAALSRALVAVTGRSTKELVTDRVMLEAARLLRSTPLGIGQVAHAVGFGDQLYFSRAFRRHTEHPPSAYRARFGG